MTKYYFQAITKGGCCVYASRQAKNIVDLENILRGSNFKMYRLVDTDNVFKSL